MDLKTTSKLILKAVSGESNVKTIVHCSTRLRINVYDLKKVDIDQLKSLNGVIGVNVQGTQVQVIIGADVDKVYKEITSIANFSSNNINKTRENEKGNVISTIIDMIAGAFTPILPAITGAGMTKAILAILVAGHWINTDNQTYLLLNLFSDGVFYFLPIMLAYTFASKLKCNVGIAMSIAAIMLHPNFSALVAANKPAFFLGLPIRLVGYSGSVIPILLSVLAMKYIEQFADKVSPKLMKSFLKPLITLLITAPIALIVLGPLGSYLSDYLVIFVEFLSGRLGWLLLAILGAFMPVITMTGLHYSLMPIIIDNLSKKGFEGIFVPAVLAANVAQGSAAIAVALKTKDKHLKQIGFSSSLSAYCGITEPAMYGINLKLKKPFIAAMIGGGCGGLYAGIMGVKIFSFGAVGLIGLPLFISSDFPTNIVHTIITCLISIVVTFIATWILYKPEEIKEENETANENHESTNSIKLEHSVHICSPMNGSTLNLNQMNDDTFNYMGKGIAIKPDDGKVFSPISGVVKFVFQTKHAIGIIDDNGVELLIHVGINTVNLHGKYFTIFVKEGDKVAVGDKLVEFNKESIEKEGYDVTTAIIVTNSTQFYEVRVMSEEKVVIGEELLLIQ